MSSLACERPERAGVPALFASAGRELKSLIEASCISLVLLHNSIYARLVSAYIS